MTGAHGRPWEITGLVGDHARPWELVGDSHRERVFLVAVCEALRDDARGKLGGRERWLPLAQLF